jgi:hypothetical protein
MTTTIKPPAINREITQSLGISRNTIWKYIGLGLTDLTPDGIRAFKARTTGIHGGLGKRSGSATPRYMLAPSTHAVWHLAEIARDLKSFPDWGVLWDAEKKKRSDAARQRESWQKTARPKRDQINARIRQYRSTEEAKAKRRAYKKRAIELNPILKVEGALRARLVKFIRGNNKSGIRNLLGCSWLQFRRHLESKFKRGMTWANYGTHWHVDHIIPCSSFDHRNPAHVRQCWHFTNLRPLEAAKNLTKGAKIESPQLSLLLTI